MLEENVPAALKFIPAEEFIISDLETLKVLADPLRLNIIEYLHKPATVKQIAKQINKPPTKLYYHFNLLEKHGLIQMVDTRIVSGIVEKHYQAAAKLYRIEKNLLSPGTNEYNEGLDITLAGLFGDMRNDLQASLKAGVADNSDDAPKHRRVMITQGRFVLPADQAESFYDRMLALLKEFDAFRDSDGEGSVESADTLPYKVLVLVHPSSQETETDEE